MSEKKDDRIKEERTADAQTSEDAKAVTESDGEAYDEQSADEASADMEPSVDDEEAADEEQSESDDKTSADTEQTVTDGETAADADGKDASHTDTPKEKEGKFFKKNKKADKKDKQQEKIEELEDRVRRQMAEFENFRKRTEKEKTAMFETGARSVIEKILPVVDNFERGLASVPEEEKSGPFAEGMSMVYKQLISELEKLEVRPIEAVGKEFNPDFHNAVMQVESEEYESGMIAQELQKGYTYRDTVVRHSMVAVVP
ncbi:MAG: nucleotide exchange factor GrpE [Lachnospiraceae bacterium]|nr:nucleotide exchange factor GrpE [Lachnospiraceae bacterium]